MKLKKNRKFLVAMAIVLALVIGASATFAWVTASAQKANEFKNEGYGSASNGMEVIENQDEFDFEPIGVKVPKEVSVINTTANPMLARVSFEEMINLLGNDGKYTWTTSAPPAAPGFSAVRYNMANIIFWKEITSVTPALPTGVKAYTPNPDAAQPLIELVYTDASSMTWLARFDTATKPVYTPNATAGLAGTITSAPAVQYAYYTNGTAFYNTWNGKDNYTAAGWQLKAGGKTSIKPAAATIVSKVGKSSLAPTGTAYATAVATEAAKIKFYYDVLAATAVGNNAEWYYNDADGYFYYMKVIPGGGSSAMLLEALELSSAATADLWKKYEYTLVICVEGIQATKAALADATDLGTASGWALSGTLLTQLEAAITAYEATL